MDNFTFLKKSIYYWGPAIGLSMLLLTRAVTVHAAVGDQGDTQVVGTEVSRTTDSHGITTETRVVKKIRTRTVVDFEEASIEGKVKKPNAAYLLHGADLEFKHLYELKNGQKNKILSSYEYIR